MKAREAHMAFIDFVPDHYGGPELARFDNPVVMYNRVYVLGPSNPEGYWYIFSSTKIVRR